MNSKIDLGQHPTAVSILGIPYDDNSSYLQGPAQAPSEIRKVLASTSSNLWSESGLDLSKPGTFYDAGDVSFPKGVSMVEAVERTVADALKLGFPLVSLGGDHSVTFPIIKAFHAFHPDLSILHFDAHPDLYEELDGNRLSHACPFARIMENGLAKRLIQVGIRTLNKHQQDQAQKWSVELISMRELAKFEKLKLRPPVYVSVDLDVLDPAFAPGISHYEPGGMSVRELLSCIQSISVPLVGADIVEYNPRLDWHSQTAMVCRKLLKEIAANMLGPTAS